MSKASNFFELIKRKILIKKSLYYNFSVKLKICIFLTFIFSYSLISAATFTVSNLNNAGVGSLRQAIINANGAGSGGHNIVFTVSGIISLTSDLPVITNNNITIDGFGQNVVVSANGGDISRYVFRGNGGADFLTVRNLEIKNTGLEAFRFDGSPTDVTIENVRWYNDFGNFYNHGILYVGNALNLSVINVTAEDQQNFNAVLEITGSATNLLVDNLTFDNNLSDHRNTEVIRIGGAATNCTFQNCNWDLNNGISNDNGDFGIYFYSTVTNCTIKNMNILNCEYMPLYFRLAVNGLNISNLTTSNGNGRGDACGIYFNYPVSNLSLDTVVIDLNHTNSTNDGDYGIFFRYDAINVNIDSLEIYDGEIHNIYVGRTTDNFTLKRATLGNFNGWVNHQSVRFQGNVNNVSFENVNIDGNLDGSSNNGDYGILFNSANVVGVSLKNVKVTGFDVDGIFMYEVDNLLMDGCELTNNFDGFELYDGHDRSNNIIKNSIFSNNTRGGLLINVANATNQFQIDSNTFSNNQKGVWLYSTGGVKDIQIRDNIFSNNSQDGIYNEQADGVLYQRNLMWGNAEGIDNVGNNGNNGLELSNGKVPVLLSSTNVGGGNYELTFTLPSECGASNCDVEIFTNLLNDNFLNGRNYRGVFTNLGTGSHTVTVNSGGNTKGFWTATLKVASLNNSVSEFSAPLTIQPQSPAGVSNGIALWMSADAAVTEINGNSITEWRDRAGINTPNFYNSDPDLLDDAANLVNFNPTVEFDGNDYIRWDGNNFYNGFTAGEVFTVVKEGVGATTANGHPFDFGGGGASHYTWSNQYIYDDFGSSDRKVWRPNNGTLSFTEGTASGATLSGPNVSTQDYNIYNVFSETNNWQSSFNGITAVTDITNTVNFSGIPHLGARSGGIWNGLLPEVVFYNRVLDLNERQRVNTYLAIKYGLTLGHNYYASDWDGSTGTTLWTIGGGYDNDIAGIGRDDVGSLYQNQSKSINSDALVSIYNGDQSSGFPVSNALNVDTPLTDLSFMLWGNNDSTTNFSELYTPNSFTTPIGVSYYHMKRIWNVAETGSIGNVTLTIPSNSRAEHILIHNSDDFSTGTPTEIQLQNDGQGNLFAVVDFTNGQFFTFGFQQKSPGCVGNGLRVWYDANFAPQAITDGFAWKDKSLNFIDVEQTVDAREATFNPVANEAHNFHTFIEFDGNDVYESDEQVLQSATSDGTVFFVATYTNFAGYDSPVDFDADDPHLGRNTGSPNPMLWKNGSSPNPFVATTLSMQLNQNHLQGFVWAGGTNGGAELRLDGAFETNPNIDMNNIGYTQNFGVGGYITGAEGINGTMSEVIVYEEKLSPLEINQVETYLGLKYGITLQHDYIAGDGSIVWDYASLSTYHNNVAGIGRDDCGGLFQKQSKSINSSSVITISKGALAQSNASNFNTLDDNSFLIWGSDNKGFGFQTTDMPATGFNCGGRIAQEWKVQERGNIDNVSLKFGGNAFTIPSLATNVNLMIDTDGDGDFTTGSTTLVAPDSINNGIAYFSGLDLNNNDVFTFAWDLPAPGGIIATSQVNGVHYKYYSDSETDVSTIESELTAQGFISSLTNPDDIMLDEDPDFTLELTTEIEITTAGDYNFRFVSLDDYGAIDIDGVQYLNHNGACCPTIATGPITLTAGRHELVVRWSDIGGVSTLNVQYNGPDNGNTWTAIPDDRMFVNPSIALWLRADEGVENTGNATTATVWNDQSIYSNSVTASEGTPTYFDNTATELINFNPSVDFNGASAMYGADNLNGFAFDKQGRTVFVVNKPNTIAGNQYFFSQGRDAVSAAHFALRSSAGSGDLIGWSAANDVYVSGFYTANQPKLITGLYENFDINGVNNAQVYGNGELLGQNNRNLRTQFNGGVDLVIGDIVDGTARYNGNIAEVIYYPWNLATQEREQVESYLGMKYALTQEHDYFSSTGTLLWDSSASGIYHHNIAAIARDDCAGLYQKQSKSVGLDEIVTIYNGNQSNGIPTTNAENNSTITTNQSFMIWGSTDSSIIFSKPYTPVSFPLPINTEYFLMKRVWKIAESGNVATVTVSVPKWTRAEHIIVHNTDDFSTGTPTEIELQDDGEGSLYAILDLTDGQFFTFGFLQKTPGCVGAGLQLWLLPDNLPAGVLDSMGWMDNSLLYNDFSTVNSTPTLVEGGVNFNNYVEFNPGDYLSKPSISSAFTAGEVFSMLQTNSVSTQQGHGFYFGGNAQGGSHYTWNNAAIYEHFGTTDRLGWNPSTGAVIQGKTGTTVNSSQTFDVLDWNLYNVRSDAGLWATAFNGFTQAEGATNTVDFTSTTNYIGYNGSQNWNGNNAETILYNRVLTDDERKQVNTYIAIKYGITLHHDYLAGDGVVLWDSAALASYHNNVAGIGREDCAGFNQKQSKSLNDNAVITISHVNKAENNALNTNDILTDTTYLLWGHDNAGYTFQTTDMPTVGFSCGGRIAQEWKVQERGDIDNISIEFGGNAFSVPSTASNVSLLIDTDGDGDFTTGTVNIVEVDSVSNGIAYFSSVDLNHNGVFTFGWSQEAPGGISTNNTVWLKANAETYSDAGTTVVNTSGTNNVQEWHDLSGNPAFVGNQPNQLTVARRPSFVENGINFNPSLYFAGADDGLTTPNQINSNDLRDVAGQSSSVYVVGNSENTADHAFFDHGNAGADNFIVTTNRAALGQSSNAGYTTNVTDDFRIVSGVRNGTGFMEMYLDGILNASQNNAGVAAVNDLFYIGTNNAFGNDYVGNISEIIIFKDGHTIAQREQVQSYLALKYGITTMHDYISSNGTLLWDSSALATYHNDVAGIGIDSCSGLFQKQSKSQNTDAIVAMYNGDHVGFLPPLNTDNPEEFTVNNSFLIWGNNDEAVTYTGNYPTNTYIDIMERIWHVQETGTVGTITLTVDDPEAEILIVDADGDFTDGNSIEYALTNGEIAIDLSDGAYFTFGKFICKEVATVACATSFSVDLTSYITNYTPGGTWTDETASGVNLTDPTSVDFSVTALGTHTFKYLGVNNTCDIVNVERLVSIPAPIVSDILVCEGGVTEITIPTPPDREEVLWVESFTGNVGYKIRSRCTGTDVSSCYVDNSSSLSAFGLELDPGIDFSSWNSGYWSWLYGGGARLQFGRLRDVEVSLTTDSAYTLLPGETMIFSGQSERWWGVMEPDDYVKFFYVVDGVETEFASRNGQISAAFETSEGSYTNNSGVPQQIEMRVKVKNSWNEGHRIDNFKMSKILAPPTYTFYADAALTSVLATGLSYDPMTAPGTIDTVYVTRTENGCESIADTVIIEVSPNSVTPMAGEAAFYCTGGGPIDLTAHISNYQPGGTWTDENGSGVDLSDPTSVDVSSLADDSYNFRYELNGIAPCNGEQAMVTINVGLQPETPEIDDISVCEGGSTLISVPTPEFQKEELYFQPFNGSNGGYIILSRCTDSSSNSCRIDDVADLANRGLTLDTSSIDFSNWTNWDTWIYDVNNLRFGRLMDEEMILSTDSFVLLDGEVAEFSGDSRRYFGNLELDDYVKFFYVVDGVETEFDSRNGNISTAFSTSNGVYENNTGSPVFVQLRFKVKNSNGEGHIVDNLRITKTLNKPVNNFYSDAVLTSLLASGYSYDPATVAGTSDTVYVTTLLNGCESLADTVIVSVDTNDVTPMDGSELFYCGGTSTDLTSLVSNYQPGGVWTDIDGAGVDLSDSSNVDFSAVVDGSYNFSYLVAGSCADEEVLVSIHIGILGGDPFVVQDGLVSTSLTECEDGDWIYFVDPNDDSRRIAAIRKNGNVVSPSEFSVTVDVDAPAVDLERAGASEAVRLMRRFLQINCPTCGTLSPAIDVRMYWNPVEQTDAGTAMDNLMTANSITGTKVWEWFKVVHDANDIPANLTEAGITDNSGTAMTWATPDETGVELNGVSYVQFNNITSLSTFGGGWHVNQVDATILPIDLIYLKATAIDNEFIRIDWATATEVNNEGFELQRSIDGISFETIAWINGNGNSNNIIQYSYDDKEVTTNVYYYRLKQIDFNGDFELSDIVNASITKEEALFEVKLIPNPSEGFGKISIFTPNEQDAYIEIVDNVGSRILSKNIMLNTGLNIVEMQDGIYRSGVYYVIIYRSNEAPRSLKWIIIE